MLKLDDFLLEQNRYRSKLGDLVFQMGGVQAASYSKLQRIQEKQKELEKQWKLIKQYYIDGDILEQYKRPAVGTTEFLGKYRVNGNVITPEFRPGDYWAHRFHAWTNAKKATMHNNSDGFTQDEIDLFFGGKEENIKAIPLDNYSDWKEGDEYKEEFGSDEQKRLRKLMEEKWTKQAEYGTEVHNVLQKLFTRTNNGKGSYWLDLVTGDQKNLHRKNFEENLRNTWKSISDVTTSDIIDQAIQRATEIRQSLQNELGEGLEFLPEFSISTTLNKEFEGQVGMSLVGRIDLLVLDSKGVPHIVDYKTSPKSYDQYNSAKKLGFTYQLAIYERMLGLHGLSTSASQIFVAPIKLDEFKKEGDAWSYKSISNGDPEGKGIVNLTSRANSERVLDNLSEFIELPLNIDGDTEDIISNTSERVGKWFPKRGNEQRKSDEQILELIKEKGADKLNEETGKYEFVIGNRKITATKKEGEAVLFNRVKDYYNNNKEKGKKDAITLKKALQKAQNGEEWQLDPIFGDWGSRVMSKYANGEWRVMEGQAADAAEQFGIILLQNKTSNLVEVVRVSHQFLKEKVDWGDGRTNLVGAHELDIQEDAKSDSYMLKAVNGNIQLMETMHVLNSIHFSQPISLGKIQLISTIQQNGLSASNKELMYCWNKFRALEKYMNDAPAEYTDNFGKDGNIKMLSDVELCYNEFNEIMARVGEGYVSRKLNACKPVLQELQMSIVPGNTEETLIQLRKLEQYLKKEFSAVLGKDVRGGKSIHSELQDYDAQYAKTLYARVLLAMAEIRNIPLRQILKDHDNWMEHSNILRKGLSGTMMDNPGSFSNQLLNAITELTLEGYQNSRDATSNSFRELRDRVEKLKKNSGFSGVLEHTIGNQANLYKGMTYYSNGDFLFKNPWKDTTGLTTEQAEFLKYIIIETNKRTHSGTSNEELMMHLQNGDIEYFQAPLIAASTASQISQEGWFGWLKRKFKLLDPRDRFKNLRKAMSDAASEYLSMEEEKQQSTNEVVFKVVNLMNQGFGDRRLSIIEDRIATYGNTFFETDLEKILGNTIWAYATEQAMEDRMTLIKSAYVSLAIMGNEQNMEFENDAKFIEKFVKNKINKQSIDDPRLAPIKGVTKKSLQQAASWMSLAFSPIQFSYQMLEGIWKDAKLIWMNNGSSEAFSFQNMKDAASEVYRELINFSDNNTICKGVNSLYGINDMDNASFSENNSSNNHGIFNFFGKFAYRFSSRPDFYNRMTIFVSQMKNDGSWEAHSIKDNKLVYDWKKDKRFAVYAKGDKSNMKEYNDAYARYLATAQQLVAEGVRNADGSLFKVGDALPKAYSNRESESMKSVADTMYGYYDSTKKSMMQATFLGSLVMQMKTYWSAKKNQYLAPGGIKQQGHFEQAVSPNGKKLFYALDEKGEIDQNAPLLEEGDPNCSTVPFMQWKGEFSEGIIVTLGNLAYACRTQNTLKFWDIWNQQFWNNSDENLRKVYRANLRLLISDLFIWLVLGSFFGGLLGDWSKEEAKKAKDSGRLEDAIQTTVAGLVSKTWINSTLDANFFSSIFKTSIEWNPFAVSRMVATTKNLYNFAFGDDNFYDTIVKNFAAAKNVKPIFTYLNQE